MNGYFLVMSLSNLILNNWPSLKLRVISFLKLNLNFQPFCTFKKLHGQFWIFIVLTILDIYLCHNVFGVLIQNITRCFNFNMI